MSKTRNVLWKILRTTSASAGTPRIVKLINPTKKGQIVRADICSLRCIDSEVIESTYDLAEPLQTYDGEIFQLDELCDLNRLFRASAAAVVLRDSSAIETGTDAETLSSFASAELDNRLSFPWIIEHPQDRKSLVIVEGCRVHPSNGGTGPNVYLPAMALGIDMIVLDNPGHWLEGPEFAHWRKQFIPLKLTQPPEPDFPDRIVSAVQSYGKPVDGIITFCDSFQPHVARAAQQLGLPYATPEAFEIATDKFKTSIFEGRNSYRASSAEEAMSIVKQDPSVFPAILKPCNGWSSEGVFRADDLAEMQSALESLHFLSSSRHGGDFVIERYCSGPEVDINLIMVDGEVMFFEVCDDYPKGADVNGAGSGSAKNFLETQTVFPSKLPPAEIKLLRICFQNTLLRLGMRNGIMHLEGRVDNSTFEYRNDEGVIDLHPRKGARDTCSDPDAWLIEINPRPPGMTGTQIIESTYGVDYWGLGLLIAISDAQRARALCNAFKYGPQYTCIMVFIPADYDPSREGIFDSEDICAELLARKPDLTRNISRCGCLVRRGEKVPHPNTGVNSFLAYFNVFSRKSRKEALELADQIRQEVRYQFL